MTSISFTKKILLSLVFVGVYFLQAIAQLGHFINLIIPHIARTTMYLLVVATLLKGFSLDQKQSAFYNFPNFLKPTDSQVLGVATTTIEYPVLVEAKELPPVTARSILIADITNHKVLKEINANAKLAPASTTKLVTTLVALDLYDLNDKVIIPEFCTQIEGQKSGFYANDMFSTEDLIYSLLVNSGADAACSLSVGKVSYEEFVDLMNKKAKALGMYNTHFSNPVGLDSQNGDQYSTAIDLYKAALVVRDNEFLKNVISTREKTIKGAEGFEIDLYTTNELLWTLPGSVGIKTGKTEAAGEVLIYEYNKDSRDLMIIVMGSEDRFLDTTKLLNWTLTSYSWGI